MIQMCDFMFCELLHKFFTVKREQVCDSFAYSPYPASLRKKSNLVLGQCPRDPIFSSLQQDKTHFSFRPEGSDNNTCKKKTI